MKLILFQKPLNELTKLSLMEDFRVFRNYFCAFFSVHPVFIAPVSKHADLTSHRDAFTETDALGNAGRTVK